MKKATHKPLWLICTVLLALITMLAVSIPAKADDLITPKLTIQQGEDLTKASFVTVNGFSDLIMQFGETGAKYIRLGKDCTIQVDDVGQSLTGGPLKFHLEERVTLANIYGEHVLDLNGHTITFYGKGHLCSRYFLFGVEGSLTVCDLSKEQKGKITSNANMTRRDTKNAENDQYRRDIFYVGSKGHLTVNSGSIVAGRSKENHMALGVAINGVYQEDFEYHISNGDIGSAYYYEQVSGSAITVKEGGSLTVNGGEISGRGFDYCKIRYFTDQGDGLTTNIEFEYYLASAIQYESGAHIVINDAIIKGRNCHAINCINGKDSIIINAGKVYLKNTGFVYLAMIHPWKLDKGLQTYTSYPLIVSPTYGLEQTLYENYTSNLLSDGETVGRAGGLTYGENIIPPDKNPFSLVGNGTTDTPDYVTYEKGSEKFLSIKSEEELLYFPELKYQTGIGHTFSAYYSIAKVGETSKKITGFNLVDEKVPLATVLASAEKGQDYMLSIHLNERWDSTHTYTIYNSGSIQVHIMTDEEAARANCQHANKDLIKDTATCVKDGKKYYVCVDCGATFEEDSPMLGHEYSGEYTKINVIYCAEKCIHCGKTRNAAYHTFDTIVSTRKMSGNTAMVTRECTKCHFRKELYENLPCEHDYSRQQYSYDSDKHWHFCKICSHKEEAAHSFDSSGECVVCRYNSGGEVEKSTDGSYISLPYYICTHGTLMGTMHLTAAFQSKYEVTTSGIVWSALTVDGKQKEIYRGTRLNFEDSFNHDPDLHPEGVIYCSYYYRGTLLLQTYCYIVPSTESLGKEPTCTEPGYKTCEYCNRCGKYFDSNGNQILNAELAALGHKYEYACSEECSRCHEKRTVTHTWKPELQYDDETHYKECSVCHITQDQEAHSFEAKEDEEKKIRTFVCTECGYEYSEKMEIKEAHHYEVVETVKATCTEAGSVTYKCDHCGDTYSIVLSAKGHLITEYEQTPSTCIHHGKKSHFFCATCGKNFEDEDGTKEITAESLILPLDPSNHETTSAHDYEFNVTHHWAACVCGVVITKGEHTMGEDGKCSVCGYHKEPVADEEFGDSVPDITTPEIGDPSPTNGEGQELMPPEDIEEDNGNSWKLPLWFLILLIVLALILIGLVVLIIVLSSKKNKKKKVDAKPQE